MDAFLMFSAPATPTPAHANPASTPASHAAPPGLRLETSHPADRPAQTPNGRIFAGLMRGLLPSHERQDVAAETPTSHTETGDLKTEVLGEQINVITTSHTPSDADSLSAFAKAQGLDEAAVKALFGDMAAQDPAQADAAAALQAMTLAADPALAGSVPAGQTTAADLAWLASQLSTEISMQISGLKDPSAASSPLATGSGLPSPVLITGEAATPPLMDWAAMATALPSSLPTAASALGISSASVAMSETPGLSVTLPSSGLFGTVATTTTANPLNMNALTTSSPMQASLIQAPVVPEVLTPVVLTPAAAPLGGQMPATSAALQVQGPAANEALTTPVAATLGLDGLAPDVAQPEDAMRIRLVPAWAVVTQQLTQMSGTAMTSTWGALTATTLGAPIRSVALDLTSALAAESEELNALTGSESGWPAPGSDNARPSQLNPTLPSTTPTPGMAQTLRQEHYQQLANRLGQAMAERLQGQIARGEWKLQMRLNPANLGRIDVELDMHAQGLDAMFRSENPLTRELMVHSMPKLRDSLSQSGMAVASVWVNSDAGRQSDGNPTPQKDRATVADTPNSAPAEVEAVPVTQPKRNQDGFDVLA